MSKSDVDRKERESKELEAKTIAYYSVMLDAWVETRLARDKTLVSLSAGGVGVLVTLLTTKGVSHLWELGLYLGSFGGFLVTLLLALTLYQKNSELIENDLRGTSSEHLKLKAFDQATIVAFCFGTLFAVSIAVSSAVNQIHKERVHAMSSYEQKSLEGINNLKPRPPQEQPPAQPSAQQSPAGTPQPVINNPKK